jgi:hypothetical protein
MTHLRTAALLLVFSVTPGCGTVDGGDDPNGNGNTSTGDPSATFAVAARDAIHLNEGEVVLNLHWYPLGSAGGNLSLRIDGRTAVWGDESMPPPGYEATPGEALSLHPETGAPTKANVPIGIPPGTYDLEYVLDGKVVASLPDQTLDEANIYSFVAYGAVAAPSFKLFVDANPLVTPDAYPADEMTLKVVNFATSGAAIGLYTQVPQGPWPTEWTFKGLAYGEERVLTVEEGASLMFSDSPSEDVPLGGFGPVLARFRFGRMFVYDRSGGNADSLVPVGDGYWQR